MQTKRLIIVAVGGQGNLLASRVLGEAALLEDQPVRLSEIHGMAQRGGVVESALVFGEALSPVISDGNADVLLGFEPCETLRAMKRCHADSVVVTNTRPLPPFTVAIGQGRYPDTENLEALLSGRVRTVLAFDATALARSAGNVLATNMVLIGALSGAGAVPVSADAVRRVIETLTKKAFVDTNLKAFEFGYDTAARKM